MRGRTVSPDYASQITYLFINDAGKTQFTRLMLTQVTCVNLTDVVAVLDFVYRFVHL